MTRAKPGSRRRDLRNFGLTMAGALAVLGGLALWRGKTYGPVLLGAAAAFVLAGLVSPGVLAPVRRGWLALGMVLGWVMTRVILAVLFYAAITPIGLIARLSGRRFLDLGIDRSAPTYWVRREHPATSGDDGRERARYEQQF